MTKWKEHIYINIDIYFLNRNVSLLICSIIVSARVTCHLTENCLYSMPSSTWPVVAIFRSWVCSVYIFSNKEIQSFQHYNTCIMSLCFMNSSSSLPPENWNKMKKKNKTRKKKPNTSQNLQLLYFSEHLLQYELWIMQLPSPSYLMLQAGVFKHQWKRLDMLSSQFIATP